MLGDVVSRIEDGASLCLAPDYSGCSFAFIKMLIRQSARKLHLIGCPHLGLQAELLIASGCVASIETAAIGLGEAGQAPAFAKAYREGTIDVFESTCPAIHSALQASEKGVPFFPVASVLGSDLIKARPDWRVIDDPFGQGQILAVPAIKPDFALFHAPLADRDGAVWIGVRRELMLMAHASTASFVSVEAVQSQSLIGDKQLASGTIPSMYIDCVEAIPDGAKPGGLFGQYSADQDWLERYLQAAKDPSALTRFIDQWVQA